MALLKGLEVRIINWFGHQAANVYLSELKELGAKIHLYGKGYMHQKLMLIDYRLAIVGTVNFHNRSFRLNFEVTCAVFMMVKFLWTQK
jgi:cardiolipin synthase